MADGTTRHGVGAPRGDRPVLRGCAHDVPPATIRLAGRALELAARIGATSIGGRALLAVGEATLGVRAMRRLPRALRADLPLDQRPIAAGARRWADAGLPVSVVSGSCADVQRALDAGLDPLDLVDRALDALDALAARVPTMDVAVALDAEAARRAAVASRDRIRAGRGRALEGVPFLVKDQHDVEGLPTRFGSRAPAAPASEDATLVARLRAAGAIPIAKSRMTEWGISPFGVSSHQPMPRNPHDPSRLPGGSSTGSAVGVALGAAVFATGADGGGSIRVPAALSGVWGLKPTFGRVSRRGDAFGGTLSHLGPIARSVADLAAFLDAAAATPDPGDPACAWAPASSSDRPFSQRLGDGVQGLRVGVCEREWEDTSPAIARAAEHALAALEREGARLVRVRIPLASQAVAMGVAIMGAEGAALHGDTTRAQRALASADVRVSLAAALATSSTAHLDAERLRAQLRRELAAALAMADVIALPVLPGRAPTHPGGDPDALASDMALLAWMCRHAFLANLTGAPALSAPIATDERGAPIGLQLVGDAWDEAGLLAVAAHLERTGIAGLRTPPGAIDLLA